METRTIALVVSGIVLLLVLAWYFLWQFHPSQVVAFRFKGLDPEWVVSADSNPFLNEGVKATERIWKTTDGVQIMFRDEVCWNITLSVYLAGVIDGGSGGNFRSQTVDKYPFLCDWGTRKVQVKRRFHSGWTDIDTLVPPKTPVALATFSGR